MSVCWIPFRRACQTAMMVFRVGALDAKPYRPFSPENYADQLQMYAWTTTSHFAGSWRVSLFFDKSTFCLHIIHDTSCLTHERVIPASNCPRRGKYAPSAIVRIPVPVAPARVEGQTLVFGGALTLRCCQTFNTQSIRSISERHIALRSILRPFSFVTLSLHSSRPSCFALLKPSSFIIARVMLTTQL